ncbi:transglutaminase domain-containing protein [Burkholderia cenocepacia]
MYQECGWRNSAQVSIAIARLVTIPARFRSSYLIDDGHETRAVGHAWAEVYVEHRG